MTRTNVRHRHDISMSVGPGPSSAGLDGVPTDREWIAQTIGGGRSSDVPVVAPVYPYVDRPGGSRMARHGNSELRYNAMLAGEGARGEVIRPAASVRLSCRGGLVVWLLSMDQIGLVSDAMAANEGSSTDEALFGVNTGDHGWCVLKLFPFKLNINPKRSWQMAGGPRSQSAQ